MLDNLTLQLDIDIQRMNQADSLTPSIIIKKMIKGVVPGLSLALDLGNVRSFVCVCV